MAFRISGQLSEAHLEFISNHTGTTVTEVFLVVAIPQLVLLFQVLLVMCPTLLNKNLGTRFGFEILLITLPQLALCTILSDYAEEIGVILVVLCMLLSICTAIQVQNKTLPSTEEIQLQFSGTRHYITTFRGGLLVLTVICILAVDFPIFPRRFAKAETYGYGLMDLGIGLFIVSHAIVSPESKGICFSLKKCLHHTMKSSVSLIALGLGRILAVKTSGYHEHLSEGGPQWNFFFTIAFTKILATLLFILISPKYSIFIAAFIISTYQSLLTRHGLSKILLEDASIPSDGVWYYIYANRDGLCSCIGYLSIYFTTVTLGRYLLTIKRETAYDWWKVAGKLYLTSGVLLGILWASHQYIDPVSRRLVNFTYVLWVISFTLLSLATSIISDLVMIALKHIRPNVVLQRKTLQESKKNDSFRRLAGDTKGSLILHAANFNGLLYFLLANIVTGIVNLNLETIHAPPLTAWTVLVAYLLLTSALLIYLDIRHIRVKTSSLALVCKGEIPRNTY